MIPARALVTALNPASDFDQKKAAIVEIATTCWQVGWDAALEKLEKTVAEHPAVGSDIRWLHTLIEGMKSKASTVCRDDDSQGTLPSNFVSTDGREVVEGGSAGG